MTQVEDKYLPSKESQIQTVMVQIGEAQSIAYRYTLEVREAKTSGDSNKIEEAELNIGRMKKKLDLLFTVLEELQA